MSALERAEALARRLPEGADALHVALMRGSFGLAQLLRSSAGPYLPLLDESLRASERAASHIYATISRHLL
jgi:hypothetical protein